MKHIRFTALILLTAFLLAGCGGAGKPADTKNSAAPLSTPAATKEPVATPEEPKLSETITLPDGWSMDQAVLVEEVETVTGLTGYQFFPEGASDAKNGNPAGSFTVSGKGNFKVGFFVYTKGKQEKADYFKDFAIEGSVTAMNSPLWDSAYIADFKDQSSAIVVLRGDCCMRINFFPAGHTGKEKAALGAALAELLINKLYGGEAQAGTAGAAAPAGSAQTPAPQASGGIPDALPADLTDAAALNEFATKLFLEHVKANIFIAPVFSDEEEDNARKALPLIIEAATKAIGLYDQNADFYFLRGKAYAYTYYDTKDAALKENGLADLQKAMDIGQSMAKAEYDQLASK